MATLNDTHRLSTTSHRRYGRLIAGLYAWGTAAYFGCVWLDIVYARVLVGRGPALGAVADVLLVASAGMVLAGIAAIALAWNSPRARGSLLASLVLALLMFPAPALLSAILGGIAGSAGTAVRLALTAFVSILAFIGFGQLEWDG